MNCQLTNDYSVTANGLPIFLVGTTPIAMKTSLPRQSAPNSKPIFSVETFARMELSLVPEIECVFFEHEGKNEFRIITVVNKRDVAIREKVYAREEAIMQEYPGINFDFHVLARMDRKIEDVITKVGKLIFER